MCLEDTITHLAKESKRLSQEQGRIARRNARRSVLGALRQVRNVLNEEFPQIIKVQAETDKLFVIEVFIRPDKWSKGKGRWIGLWSPSSNLSTIPGGLRYRLAPMVRNHEEQVDLMRCASWSMPNRLFGKNGKVKPMPFEKAAKYAKRLSLKFPSDVWRIRSGKDIIVANVL